MAMTTPAAAWQPEQERIDREELEQLQLERLEATLTRAYRHVPYYRKRSTRSASIPTASARWRTWPGSPSPPRRTCAPTSRTGSSPCHSATWSGSTPPPGPPARPPPSLHRNDLRTWADLTARALVAGGVTRDDVVQIAFDYGLFTGAFGLHAGAERVGASVIPVSSADAARQVAILKDYKSTALCCAPSRAMAIADAVAAAGLPRGALHLKWGSSAPSRGRRRCGASSRRSSAWWPPTTTASPR